MSEELNGHRAKCVEFDRACQYRARSTGQAVQWFCICVPVEIVAAYRQHRKAKRRKKEKYFSGRKGNALHQREPEPKPPDMKLIQESDPFIFDMRAKGMFYLFREVEIGFQWLVYLFKKWKWKRRKK